MDGTGSAVMWIWAAAALAGVVAGGACGRGVWADGWAGWLRLPLGMGVLALCGWEAQAVWAATEAASAEAGGAAAASAWVLAWGGLSAGLVGGVLGMPGRRAGRAAAAAAAEEEAGDQAAAASGGLGSGGRTGVEVVAAEHRPGDRRVIAIGSGGVELVMSWVPPGKFVMGSSLLEVGRAADEIQHAVVLTRGFWLACNPVTQAQWTAVMGSNPSHFTGADLPVESVGWTDVAEFCAQLGRMLDERDSRGFRLPSEAEWEYACRARTNGAFNTWKNAKRPGSGRQALNELAWYEENSMGTTHPVGLMMANAWGLHDMHGNVWEWCADWYGSYEPAEVADPSGPPSGRDRVCRGGGWGDAARYCRSAYRNRYPPGTRSDALGFRVALPAPD